MKKLIFIFFLITTFISNAQESFFKGNNNYVVTPSPPKISTITANATLITPFSANSGGNVISDGGTVTERGVVWSTSTNPTISLVTKRSANFGSGSFTTNINGLTPSTTYYVRSYATNIAGISYGTEISFTTAALNSTNSIPTVNIGNQVWTDKNLDVSTYRNGDPIPYAANATEWVAYKTAQTGAYMYLLYCSVNAGQIYGKLYNWYAVNDPRGLAPVGYHVPTTTEWTILRNIDLTGFKFRSTTTDWNASFTTYNSSNILNIENRSSQYIGDNSTSFNILPSGGIAETGTNLYAGAGIFWNSDADLVNTTKANNTFFFPTTTMNGVNAYGTLSKGFALAVRLIKD